MRLIDTVKGLRTLGSKCLAGILTDPSLTEGQRAMIERELRGRGMKAADQGDRYDREQMRAESGDAQ